MSSPFVPFRLLVLHSYVTTPPNTALMFMSVGVIMSLSSPNFLTALPCFNHSCLFSKSCSSPTLISTWMTFLVCWPFLFLRYSFLIAFCTKPLSMSTHGCIMGLIFACSCSNSDILKSYILTSHDIFLCFQISNVAQKRHMESLSTWSSLPSLLLLLRFHVF